MNNNPSDEIQNEAAQQDWKEKMNEPIGYVVLTPEQIEELKAQGHNV